MWRHCACAPPLRRARLKGETVILRLDFHFGYDTWNKTDIFAWFPMPSSTLNFDYISDLTLHLNRYFFKHFRDFHSVYRFRPFSNLIKPS